MMLAWSFGPKGRFDTVYITASSEQQSLVAPIVAQLAEPGSRGHLRPGPRRRGRRLLHPPAGAVGPRRGSGNRPHAGPARDAQPVGRPGPLGGGLPPGPVDGPGPLGQGRRCVPDSLRQRRGPPRHPGQRHAGGHLHRGRKGMEVTVTSEGRPRTTAGTARAATRRRLHLHIESAASRRARHRAAWPKAG